VPLTAALGQPLSDLLLRGRFAAIWWPRIGLEVASLLLVAFGGLDGLAAECALATLPGVLLTSALTSHGAALQAIAGVGIASDWLHIVGATVWVGVGEGVVDGVADGVGDGEAEGVGDGDTDGVGATDGTAVSIFGASPPSCTSAELAAARALAAASG